MIRTIPYNYYVGVNKKFVYKGLHHAITATGGFSIEEKTKPIQIYTVQNIAKYDLTSAAQIICDVDIFNRKLGAFDVSANRFTMDTVTICAAELIGGVTSKEHVNSVGKFENMYSEFTEYVNRFLEYEEGFSCIYLMDTKFEMDKYHFTTDDLYETMTRKTENIYGVYNDLYGSINIYGVNRLLDFTGQLNLFGNRADVSSPKSMGFISGDLVYVPYGMTITLTVELNAKNMQLNTLGQKHVAHMNAKYDYDDGFASQQTIADVDRIVRVIKVPILIQLIEIPKPKPIPLPIVISSIPGVPTVTEVSGIPVDVSGVQVVQSVSDVSGVEVQVVTDVSGVEVQAVSDVSGVEVQAVTDVSADVSVSKISNEPSGNLQSSSYIPVNPNVISMSEFLTMCEQIDQSHSPIPQFKPKPKITKPNPHPHTVLKPPPQIDPATSTEAIPQNELVNSVNKKKKPVIPRFDRAQMISNLNAYNKQYLR